MVESAVLVWDRKRKRITRVRTRREPVKVRLCRLCLRAHPATQTCRAA
jgi:hypothetical protein